MVQVSEWRYDINGDTQSGVKLQLLLQLKFLSIFLENFLRWTSSQLTFKKKFRDYFFEYIFKMLSIVNRLYASDLEVVFSVCSKI